MSQTFPAEEFTEKLGLPLWGETPPEGATGLGLRNAILGKNENSMARLLDVKVERLANKVDEISDEVTNDQYPSALAVKTYVDENRSAAGVSSWNDLTDKPFGEDSEGNVTKLDNKYLSILEDNKLKADYIPESMVTDTELEAAIANASILEDGKIKSEYIPDTLVTDSDLDTALANASILEDGKIKSEYIPDTLVTDTELEAAIANIDIPDAGVSSWNDLTDKPFGEDVDGNITKLDNKYLNILEESTNVIETEIFNEASDVRSSGLFFISASSPIIAGETYKVILNDSEFTCVATTGDNSDGTAVYIGNLSLVDESKPDTGEPFRITYEVETGAVTGKAPDYASTTINVAVYNVVESTDYTIGSEYLPDEHLTGLPEVSAKDNGKVPRVINGEWGLYKLEGSTTTLNSNIDQSEDMIYFDYSVNANDMSQMVKRGMYTDLLERPFGEIPTIFACSDDVQGTTLNLMGSSQIVNVFNFDTSVAPLCCRAILQNVSTPVIGENYTFNLGGVAYPCVAKRLYDINGDQIEKCKQVYYFGNFGLTGFPSAGIGEDTGEPFVIFWSQGNLIVYVTVEYCDTLPDGYECTASLVPVNEYFKINEKYLPDNLVTETEFPEATADDEGKFLRVVDGVATWVALTDVSQEGA